MIQTQMMKYKTLKVGQLPITDGIYLITPEYAAWLLETYNTHNRNFVSSLSMRYARDMVVGRWKLTHQGIALSPDPVIIIDGQHRLYGIVEAGVPIVMRVFVNVPLETQSFIDDGGPRTLQHTMKLAGHEVSNRHLATATVMVNAPNSQRAFWEWTKNERMEFMLRQRDPVDFAVSKAFTNPVKGITVASIQGTVARAWGHNLHQLNRLLQFSKILSTGLTQGDPYGDTVLAMRKFFIENATSLRGSVGQMEGYRKAQRMLKAYLDGELLTKCIKSDKDLFPLLDPPPEVPELPEMHTRNGSTK